MKGATKARTDMTTVPADSARETAGLAVPPEAAVDPAWTMPLMARVTKEAPPPPIMEIIQARPGARSPTRA